MKAILSKTAALALCTTGALALPSAASAASLIGNDVSCDSSDSAFFACSADTATIGDGAEFTLVDDSPFGGNLLADFMGNSLNVRADPANFGGITFSGTSPAVVSFRNLTMPFTSANLLSAADDRFTQSDISLNDGLLSLDLNGINFRPGNGGITIELANMAPTAAVPEPTTWALMLLGFAFVGGVMRTKTRQRTTVSYS